MERGSNGAFTLFAIFCKNRSTEGNEDTEDFQNQRLRLLFPSLPSVKILCDVIPDLGGCETAAP
jgi:hypothetical protein